MIAAFVIFSCTLIGKLIFDLHLYYSGEANKHTLGPMIVFIALVVCSWLGGWITIPMWWFGYWAIFDTLYAVCIGQKFYYVGTSAWLDKMQRRYPVLVYIKYGGAILGIVLFIIKGAE